MWLWLTPMTPNVRRGEAGFGVTAGCCAGIGPLLCAAARAVASCRIAAATTADDAMPLMKWRRGTAGFGILQTVIDYRPVRNAYTDAHSDAHAVSGRRPGDAAGDDHVPGPGVYLEA